MRIPLVIEALKEIVDVAAQSRRDALLCLGSAEFLLQFLQRAAEVNGVHNLHGVRERIRDVQNDLYIRACLMRPDDTSPDPEHSALQALNTLARSTLLGENPKLLQNNLTNEGQILSK